MRVAPADPGGTPHGIGRPDPTDPRIGGPTTIMEWRPAPGIIGIPIPAGITPEPAATVSIGAPRGINHCHGWLPAKTSAFLLHPISIGRQGIVKLWDGHCLLGRLGG